MAGAASRSRFSSKGFRTHRHPMADRLSQRLDCPIEVGYIRLLGEERWWAFLLSFDRRRGGVCPLSSQDRRAFVGALRAAKATSFGMASIERTDSAGMLIR